MNVLHIDEQRGWRGGEQQASYLIRGLARRGHQVAVAGRPGCPFLQANHDADLLARVAAPFRTEFDPLTPVVLARAIIRHQIDVIHAHTSHAHTAACLARILARRGRVVVSRRVDFPPRPGAFNRWKYAQPDRIVAVSSFIARVMEQYGTPSERLRVVHSGSDLSRFDVEALSRAELGVPEGVPLLGCVAALVGHKDHATLLDAMPRVLDALPGLHLLVIGEGHLRADIEAHIARLGLGGCIHLLGHRNDVPRILRALDAFVLSSKEEGFGGAALEAMACRLPVVSTDAGGMSDTVVHEKTGLLVPIRTPAALADAIIRVFKDDALVRTLRENGPGQVKNFSVDRMVEGNIAVYEELV